MKLTLAEPKYLKEPVSIISDLVNETRLKISKDSIELVAMDPANVAMVVFRLLGSAFVEYSVEKEATIAINLNSFKQILRRVKPNDLMTLELDDSRLKISLRSESTRTFSLPLIDIEEREQKVPSLSFPVSIEMPSGMLSESVDDADLVAESIDFTAEPKMLSLDAAGDTSSVHIEIRPSDSTKIETASKTKAKYSIEYLKKMVQGAKIADKVQVQFNKDYPLKLTYSTTDRVMLSFILAPRVENE